MSIHLRLILSFLTFVLLPLVFLGIFNNSNSRTRAKTQTLTYLDGLAEREKRRALDAIDALPNDPQKLASIVENYSGLGQTGETVIVGRGDNGSWVFLHAPRFPFANEQTPVDAAVSIEARALQGDEGMYSDVLDYRSTPVFAATRYIPELDWGIVTKIDKKEALAPLSFFTSFSTGIFGLFFVFFLLISWIITQSISLPIHHLMQKTKEVSEGKLSLDFPPDVVNSKDEIGQLAASFLTMTKNLKDLYGKLEQKVEEKTQALEKNIRELEALKAKDDAILAGIGDGVCAIDENGDIILFNESACRLTGYSQQDVSGHPYTNTLVFLPDEGQEKDEHQIQDIIQLALKGQTTDIHHRVVKQRGTDTLIPIAGSAAPVFHSSGSVIGVVVVFRDITKEREVEKLKDEFVSLASHELRTPMTGVKGFLYLVLSRDTSLSEKTKELLSLALSTTERLIALVNDMLDISRIEGNRMKFYPKSIDLMEITTHVKEELSVTLEKKTLRVENPSGAPMTVFADNSKIYQVITNLVGNAIKFTPPDGTITISFSKANGTVQTAVSDNGIGIQKEDLAKLFTKFGRITRSEINQPKTSGTGLGLYLTKKIIEASSGDIWVESEYGKGSTFFFTLPQAT